MKCFTKHLIINAEIKIDVSKLTAKTNPSWHIVEAAAGIFSVVTAGPAMIKFEKSRRIWQISARISSKLKYYLYFDFIDITCNEFKGTKLKKYLHSFCLLYIQLFER